MERVFSEISVIIYSTYFSSVTKEFFSANGTKKIFNSAKALKSAKTGIKESFHFEEVPRKVYFKYNKWFFLKCKDRVCTIAKELKYINKKVSESVAIF